MTTGTTGKAPVNGWEAAPIATAVWQSPVIDLSPITSPNAAATSAADISRLETELASSRDAMRAAMLRQEIASRQADWVAQAKAAGLREPTGPLDPLRATPKEIENAFLWSEIGGVIPRDELARDGGKAFTTSIRDAVVLRVKGFDALLELHGPDGQRGLLARELGLRGVKVPAGATLADLRTLYRQSRDDEEAHRPTIGLDGRTGTAERVTAYERNERIMATNPGTTVGSLMANWAAAATGDYDVERMREMGNAGNAVEETFGGSEP